MKERGTFVINAYAGFIVLAIFIGIAVYLLKPILSEQLPSISHIVIAAVLVVVSFLLLTSMRIIEPNQARVIIFFGTYLGTIRKSGIFMTVPLAKSIDISLRVRNFNSNTLKVNDIDGNPIEIAAVVVYRVVDTAKACFDVEHYEYFVAVQSETAIRHVATKYPYDTFTDSDISLRGNAEAVAEELTRELQERLSVAGVEVIEARITHLAYSPEIASAMLQRQQARAILSARQIIVEGAVYMSKTAIQQLEQDGTLNLQGEQRAKLVNNLLVSIISDRGTQPIINTGTLD
ncbi:SPFH domain-containing protein [Entomomonas asaccharolytica]|uniref:SPFH domain-containing protein n=1 Tax=Entomomonas asaccharolytica TaxID=2785331 RepID=A0A974RXU7_9GAMM|nr:SPFH domain-containing protein [Entomomonas asaccharolytica]QQP86512.1 SPFH domain-containing protein [Entomomonas asaccharolytica]